MPHQLITVTISLVLTKTGNRLFKKFDFPRAVAIRFEVVRFIVCV